MSEDAERYAIYENVRTKVETQRAAKPLVHEKLARFMQSWLPVERIVLRMEQLRTDDWLRLPPKTMTGSYLIKIGLPSNIAHEFDRLRRLRNAIVHGREIPSDVDFDEIINDIDLLYEKLRKFFEGGDKTTSP